jgi:hypothetical protein
VSWPSRPGKIKYGVIDVEHSVGRTWYVKIIQGTLTSRAFLGTAHPATGDQTWMELPWGTDMGSLSEGLILDELWAACVSMMEARTHLDVD